MQFEGYHSGRLHEWVLHIRCVWRAKLSAWPSVASASFQDGTGFGWYAQRPR
jgi:hypothetical protein